MMPWATSFQSSFWMPRITMGSPAVQSSSGAILSYSGMVRNAVSGNALPLYSLTSWALTSLIAWFGFALRISNALRKMSETVALSLIWLIAKDYHKRAAKLTGQVPNRPAYPGSPGGRQIFCCQLNS